jgi:hypothetical protein
LAEPEVSCFGKGQIAASRKVPVLVRHQFRFGRERIILEEGSKGSGPMKTLREPRCLEGAGAESRSQKGLEESPLLDSHRVVHGLLRGDAIQAQAPITGADLGPPEEEA